jgi:hypothetical protein
MSPGRIQIEPLPQRSENIKPVAGAQRRHCRRAGANRLVEKFDPLAGGINPVNTHRTTEKGLITFRPWTQQMKELSCPRGQGELWRRHNHVAVSIIHRFVGNDRADVLSDRESLRVDR